MSTPPPVCARLDRGLVAAVLVAAWAIAYGLAWGYWRAELHRPDRPFLAGIPVALGIAFLLGAVRRDLHVNRYGVTFTWWPFPLFARHAPRCEWRVVAVAKREQRFPRRTVWDVVAGTRAAGTVRLIGGYGEDTEAEDVAAQIRAALGSQLT